MVHAFAERLPQTSQSCSEAAKRGGSTDAADAAEAGAPAADAEADAEGGDTDDTDDELFLAGGSADSDDEEAGEEEGVDNDGNVKVDGPLAALDGFSPFFFVISWCVSVLVVR